MKINKLLGLVVLGATISLNASFISVLTGPNIGEDEYEDENRGIIVSKDIDGDGIIDTKDDDLNTIPCETPKPVKVTVIPDTDGDGFKDDVDQCINTPKGFEVDEVGCSKPVNLNVLFDINKATIKDGSTSNIDKLVNFMQNHPMYSVTIEGHTDSDGSSEYNKKLSEDRANAVTKYIVSKGIASEKLNIKAYGESRPLNSNTTKKEKQENRRVIAVLKK